MPLRSSPVAAGLRNRNPAPPRTQLPERLVWTFGFMATRVVELRYTYDRATRGGDSPDGRKEQGTIHWVSAPRALDVTLRLYDSCSTIRSRTPANPTSWSW